MSDKKTTLDESVDNGIDIAQGIGSAAAHVAKAAVKTAASAGSGAATGAGTGAAAGTAMGPLGTVLGSVIGLITGLLAKPIAKGLVVIFILTFGVFCSLPSMLFENPIDMLDNTGPSEVFTELKTYANNLYTEDSIRLSNAISADIALDVALEKLVYDDVVTTISYTQTEEELSKSFNLSSIFIVSMFEISTDDWKVAKLKDFKYDVDVASLFSSVLSDELVKKERQVKTEWRTVVGDDGEEREERVQVVYIDYTYRVIDNGVEKFRNYYKLDEKDFMKSIEMTYNLVDFFGEGHAMPMGGITSGGTITTPSGVTTTYPGGGTHNLIRQYLDEMENPKDFFGGSPIIPVETYHYISSRYGPRNFPPDPIHTGLDFSANEDTPIYAAMDGEVLLIIKTPYSGYGNHIVLYHGGKITTMYAHMISYGNFNVGDTVRAGDVIGYVGSTGLSTGDHLHFEYQVYGSTHNPEIYLPKNL